MSALDGFASAVIAKSPLATPPCGCSHRQLCAWVVTLHCCIVSLCLHLYLLHLCLLHLYLLHLRPQMVLVVAGLLPPGGSSAGLASTVLANKPPTA